MIWKSPVGYLEIEGSEESLSRIHFLVDLLPAKSGEKVAEGRMRGVVQELEEYFAGQRKSFDIPLAPKGTPFQLEVWRALQQIPYGATATYREIAIQIGRPNAVRAVGAANGANPIPIIIPCHRVIGSNGSLTGFGGGIDVKRALLAHESGQRVFSTS